MFIIGHQSEQSLLVNPLQQDNGGLECLVTMHTPANVNVLCMFVCYAGHC